MCATGSGTTVSGKNNCDISLLQLRSSSPRLTRRCCGLWSLFQHNVAWPLFDPPYDIGEIIQSRILMLIRPSPDIFEVAADLPR